MANGTTVAAPTQNGSAASVAAPTAAPAAPTPQQVSAKDLMNEVIMQQKANNVPLDQIYANLKADPRFKAGFDKELDGKSDQEVQRSLNLMPEQYHGGPGDIGRSARLVGQGLYEGTAQALGGPADAYRAITGGPPGPLASHILRGMGAPFSFFAGPTTQDYMDVGRSSGIVSPHVIPQDAGEVAEQGLGKAVPQVVMNWSAGPARAVISGVGSTEAADEFQQAFPKSTWESTALGAIVNATGMSVTPAGIGSTIKAAADATRRLKWAEMASIAAEHFAGVSPMHSAMTLAGEIGLPAAWDVAKRFVRDPMRVVMPGFIGATGGQGATVGPPPGEAPQGGASGSWNPTVSATGQW